MAQTVSVGIGLRDAKMKMYRIALTLPDDESADVIRIKPRRFEVKLNASISLCPVFSMSGWSARWYRDHPEYKPEGI